MKGWLVLVFMWLATYSYADQLAYISEKEADEAVKVISELKTVYFFCGCCSLEAPKKARPVKVYKKYTGYENYFEVILEYTNENGEQKSSAIDLAYVWKKKRKKYTTIGSLLNLEHDPCVQPNNWSKVKKEKE